MSFSPEPTILIHREKLSETASFNMVEVEEGRFGMGGDMYDWEKPIHEVTLGSFYVGQYPVTQDIWETIMGENPSYFTGSLRPVEQVSWEDVQVFLGKLNDRLELSGELVYRLPTEAEWEYAARGGVYTHDYRYAGSNQLDQVGWYATNSQNQTHPVGLLLPNELGLYDMSGNVWEWCADWYDDNYYEQCYEAGVVRNPSGPASGQGRVLRGGSWDDGASVCRVACRFNDTPDFRDYGIGLRLSRTAL